MLASSSNGTGFLQHVKQVAVNPSPPGFSCQLLCSFCSCVQEQLQRERSSRASTGRESCRGKREEIVIFSRKFFLLHILMSQHRGKFEGTAGCVGCKPSLESWGWLWMQRGQWGRGISKGGLWTLSSHINDAGYPVAALCTQNSSARDQARAHWNVRAGAKGGGCGGALREWPGSVGKLGKKSTENCLINKMVWSCITA